jgi:hypothetical protein
MAILRILFSLFTIATRGRAALIFVNPRKAIDIRDV